MIVAKLLQVALPFLWLGMIAAISLIETPLKFRAPGITVPLGVGIGRLVFKALNRVELVLCAALVATAFVSAGSAGSEAVLAGVALLTVFQALWLRPRMDRRVAARSAVGEAPESSSHLLYIGVEGVKLLALPLLGVLYCLQAFG
ncbi:hypothetical protein KIH31_02130 [Paenarthrobacter sp. DKR-5]|uniref:hypothetical protein n=1 Tax=Paenarthrobacter sp. DKR-5 TaxID=2835535 RepID=UPI001BDBC58D|nr:hypothetical protein [Paenarthrobacter sp. DKR-5]MBT1001389.1 hypothetical protein [Paenarthrobacter sp. DKR-5]